MPAVQTVEVVPAALATDLATAIAALVAGAESVTDQVLIDGFNAINQLILAANNFGVSAIDGGVLLNDALIIQLLVAFTALEPIADLVPVLGPASITAAGQLILGVLIAVDDLLGDPQSGLHFALVEAAGDFTQLLTTAANIALTINGALSGSLESALIALGAGIDAGTPISGALIAASILASGVGIAINDGLGLGLIIGVGQTANAAVQLNNIFTNTTLAVAAELTGGLLQAVNALAPVAALVPVLGPAATAAATALIIQGSSFVEVGLIALRDAMNQGILAAGALANDAIVAAVSLGLAVTTAIQQALGALDAVTPLAAPAAGPESLPDPAAASVALTTHDGGATFEAAAVASDTAQSLNSVGVASSEGDSTDNGATTPDAENPGTSDDTATSGDAPDSDTDTSDRDTGAGADGATGDDDSDVGDDDASDVGDNDGSDSDNSGSDNDTSDAGTTGSGGADGGADGSGGSDAGNESSAGDA